LPLGRDRIELGKDVPAPTNEALQAVLHKTITA
jgi:hypothetical protein